MLQIQVFAGFGASFGKCVLALSPVCDRQVRDAGTHFWQPGPVPHVAKGFRGCAREGSRFSSKSRFNPDSLFLPGSEPPWENVYLHSHLSVTDR